MSKSGVGFAFEVTCYSSIATPAYFPVNLSAKITNPNGSSAVHLSLCLFTLDCLGSHLGCTWRILVDVDLLKVSNSFAAATSSKTEDESSFGAKVGGLEQQLSETKKQVLDSQVSKGESWGLLGTRVGFSPRCVAERNSFWNFQCIPLVG